ncbi:MAG: hypothetical protein RSC26_13565 [Terrisporobacter sp.]
MIDKIRIYKEIELDITKFSSKFTYDNRLVPQKIDLETGEVLEDSYEVDRYIYSNNGLTIIYSMKTNKLRLEGRLPNVTMTRNLVYNLDDFMLGEKKLIKVKIDQNERDLVELCNETEYDSDDNLILSQQWQEEVKEIYVYDDIKTIISKVNDKIYELIGVRLDIKNFDITYIETTFNIFNVEYVGRYIELFNLIFKDKNDKRYINYVLEKNLALDTSFYIKTKSDYQKNIKTNYTVNFYNKLDQLLSLEKNPKNKSKITARDKELARNVLRLEVQLGYKELKKTTKKFNQFLDIDFCANIVKDKYRYFISKDEMLDFYSYRNAKKIITNTDKLSKSDKKKLLNDMEQKHRFNKNFSKQKESKYKSTLAILGIHYYFIPTKWNIEYLESPIKQLDTKIQEIESLLENRN